MIKRELESAIEPIIGTKKAIIVMGARQVGKSTLLTAMLAGRNDVMWLNGDDPDVQSLFSEMTSTRIRTILASSRILVVDEAQRIADIGLRLILSSINTRIVSEHSELICNWKRVTELLNSGV